ncbi:hypothetical protein F2Q70_00035708 [Brassica cretica]|uniref:Uncharacterized protein n=1 Tax=Brassica cretica TaxID=69181 RepID=A0A8S9JTW9_BRACR|nr:hypothetical protein F2Q70_00035708 [Brassica cretica]
MENTIKALVITRPFAELDQVQFGNWPSWIARGFRSENVRAGSNTNSAQPFTELDQSSSVNSRAGSTEVRLYLILVTPLPTSHRAHSCFISIGGIIGTLRFKNRKNSFFLEDHSDWSYKTETPSLRRAGSNTDSARPFAELDRSRIQLGERPSWIEHEFSSAVHRAGPVQFGEQPSWIDQSPSLPHPRNSIAEIASSSFLFHLDRRYHWNFTI